MLETSALNVARASIALGVFIRVAAGHADGFVITSTSHWAKFAFTVMLLVI